MHRVSSTSFIQDPHNSEEYRSLSRERGFLVLKVKKKIILIRTIKSELALASWGKKGKRQKR